MASVTFTEREPVSTRNIAYKVEFSNTFTLTPAGRNTTLGATLEKPKITRTYPTDSVRPGTRYFLIQYSASLYAIYSANFSGSIRTQTVTATLHSTVGAVGELGGGSGTSTKKFVLGMGSGTSLADSKNIGNTTANYYVYYQQWEPDPTSLDVQTSSTIDSQFGLVQGFCSANITASGRSYWSWSGGGKSGEIKSVTTVETNANGVKKSGSSTSGATTTVTQSTGTLNSTSLSVSATYKGFSTLSATNGQIPIQTYSKPTVGGLSLSRGANNYADIKFDYTLHSLNKTSNKTASITAGNATGYWKILDSSGVQVYPVSGWASNTIVADGSALANTSGTITEAISEELASDQSYTLYAYVEDRLGQTSQIMNYVLPTEYRTLDFLNGGKGAAFGKVSEYEGLDINMDVYCKPLIGSVQMYAGTTAPNGWFICDGAPKNAQDYPELFAVIRHTFGGSGDTFNLPDIIGRMPIGAGQGSGLTNRPLADKKGSEGIQQHHHSHTNPTVNGTSSVTFTGGSHDHSMTNFSSGTGSETAYMTTGNRSRTSRNTSKETHSHDLPAHTHTFTGGGVLDVKDLPSGQTVGDSGNMPPYLGINFIIHAGRPTIEE